MPENSLFTIRFLRGGWYVLSAYCVPTSVVLDSFRVCDKFVTLCMQFCSTDWGDCGIEGDLLEISQMSDSSLAFSPGWVPESSVSAVLLGCAC